VSSLRTSDPVEPGRTAFRRRSRKMSDFCTSEFEGNEVEFEFRPMVRWLLSETGREREREREDSISCVSSARF
jgi:hypothetical protein